MPGPTSPPDTPLEAALRANGMVHPQVQNQCSAQTGCSLASTCAMLVMESGGGNNEFQGGVPVTEALYKQFRAAGRIELRGQEWVLNELGVGPCQLTSVGLLDEADQHGGAWTLEANMIVGFTFLSQLQTEFGIQGGFEHYNGSGPAAVAYGQRAMALEAKWQAVINAVLEPNSGAAAVQTDSEGVPAGG